MDSCQKNESKLKKAKELFVNKRITKSMPAKLLKMLTMVEGEF